MDNSDNNKSQNYTIIKFAKIKKYEEILVAGWVRDYNHSYSATNLHLKNLGRDPHFVNEMYEFCGNDKIYIMLNLPNALYNSNYWFPKNIGAANTWWWAREMLNFIESPLIDLLYNNNSSDNNIEGII